MSETVVQATATAAAPSAPPKKKKSRKVWYLLIGFALLVIATPVAYYFVATWIADRELQALYAEIDAEDPNWRWQDILKEYQPPPDADNSALQVGKVRLLLARKAFMPGPKWDSPSRDILEPRNARLTAEYADLLSEAFARLDPATMDEARKLKDMSRGGFARTPVENPYFDIKLDYVQESRAVARLLQLDAVLRAHQGDIDGGLDSCRAIVNTAGSVKAEPFLISHLVRIAEHAIAVGAVERTLAQGAAGEESLQKLQKLLELSAAHDTLHHAIRGERAAGQQTYDLVREGKTTISEIMAGAGAKVPPQERVIDLFPGLILKGYPDYMRKMTEQVRASKLPEPERTEKLLQIEDNIRRNPSMLTRLIMPATMKVSQASQRDQAYMRTAIAALAVERYRLLHDWPRTLEDVVKAGFLKEIPTDPYDGQPLRYKRTPTGAIVYSAGFDKADNGGTINRNNFTAPGSDIGFELFDAHLRSVAPRVEDEAK
jgi:hypothetical protein